MKKLAILAAAMLAVLVTGAAASAAAEPALKVTRVNYNAVGADTMANRWQEAIYVRASADLTAPLDISGWTVHDAYKNGADEWGNAYTFPGAKGSETTVVKANGLIVVSPAAGVHKTDPNATQVFYMDFKRGHNGHFLNNGGDTVYVDDADGQRVASFVYDFDNGYYVR